MYLMIGMICSVIDLVIILLDARTKGFDEMVNKVYYCCSSVLARNLILAVWGILTACIDYYLWPLLVIGWIYDCFCWIKKIY